MFVVISHSTLLRAGVGAPRLNSLFDDLHVLVVNRACLGRINRSLNNRAFLAVVGLDAGTVLTLSNVDGRAVRLDGGGVNFKAAFRVVRVRPAMRVVSSSFSMARAFGAGNQHAIGDTWSLWEIESGGESAVGRTPGSCPLAETCPAGAQYAWGGGELEWGRRQWSDSTHTDLWSSRWNSWRAGRWWCSSSRVIRTSSSVKRCSLRGGL